MVRLSGEEKEHLLEAYTDDVESNKAHSDAQLEDEQRAAEAARHLRSRRRRRRVFHFLAITLLTLVFLGVRHFKHSRKFDLSSSFPEDEPHKLPVVPGVTLEHCTEWKGDSVSDLGDGAALFKGEDGYYIPPRPKRLAPKGNHDKGAPLIQVMPTTTKEVTSWAEFKLDAEKPLYFVSRGSFAYGSLNVVQSEDDSKDVKTRVTVRTDGDHDEGRWHQHFLDVIRVCKIKKEGDEEATGVGIFTPEWHRHGCHKRRHRHNIHFQVTIELPKSDDPLTIGSLETDMPIFSQNLQTPKGAVSYKKLHLQSALAYIAAIDATAENITVYTANAPIEGNYKASKSIILGTANAHIDVGLELVNHNSTNATTAVVSSKNGYIVTRNTLTASNWSANNTGNFSITASTANARIGLTFPSAPVNSTLNLHGYTSLGGIEASLHPTYEGEFFLGTRLSKAEVISIPGEADPENRGRFRSVLSHPMRSKVYGETWWGEYKGKQGRWGNVVLKSSLGPVVLKFNGTEV